MISIAPISLDFLVHRHRFSACDKLLVAGTMNVALVTKLTADVPPFPEEEESKYLQCNLALEPLRAQLFYLITRL